MILTWYKAGQDLTTSVENLVFRLHKVNEEKKYDYYDLSEKGNFEYYQLEVREKQKVAFTNLKYYFYTSDYPRRGEINVKRYSVDAKEWKSVNDILNKTESILYALGYIPSEFSPIPEEYATFKSEYFKVLDEGKLDKIVEEIESHTKQGIGYWQQSGDLFLIYCKNGSIYKFFNENNETLKKFQNILPENEIAVFKEIYVRKPDETEDKEDYAFDIRIMYITRDTVEFHNINKEIENKKQIILSQSLTQSYAARYPGLSYTSNKNYYPSSSEEPKERVPVTGHVFLLKNPDLNLYGFRISKSDIHPEVYAQLTFKDQKYPLEVISYFESNDVNRMFRLVKKQFEVKMVKDSDRLGELYQNNWYDLSEEDVSTIKDSTFSEIMQKKLEKIEEENNGFLTPGGYVMLFRGKDGAYHLRTTNKANYRNLIWRGSHEQSKPVICFLTKDVENLRTYFQENFRDKRDGYKDKFLFDETDMSQTIPNLPLNEELQITNAIKSF